MVTGTSPRLRFLLITSAITSLTSAAAVLRAAATTAVHKARTTNFRPTHHHRCFHRLAMATSSSSSASELQAITVDRSQFEQRIPLVALNIPAKHCTAFTKELRAHVLARPKVKRIYDAPGAPDRRLLVLSEETGADLALPTLPAPTHAFIAAHDGVPEPFTLTLGYEHVTVDAVLRRLLPTTVTEVPSSFEQVGHIAHVNLRDEALPHKHLIGHVILEKNQPNIRTVVNKIGTIETEFRTFPMELLAGEPTYDVTLKESNARFTFNFRDVYWNSRLQMEHHRLVDIVRRTAARRRRKAPHGGPLVVADMMAGVGPFAVPLAMPLPPPQQPKGTIVVPTHGPKNGPKHGPKNKSKNGSLSAGLPLVVHANDLNPASYRYLVENARNNKCGGALHTYNMDARDFILSLINRAEPFHEAIMNLPQNATDFLDVFIGLARRTPTAPIAPATTSDDAAAAATKPNPFADPSQPLPRIHVYAFSTSEDPLRDVAERAARTMQCDPALLTAHLAATTATATAAAGHAVAQSSSSSGGDGNGNGSSDISLAKNAAGKEDDGEEEEEEGEEDAAMCVGHVVRDVAPKKMMVCLSFRLPRAVADADPLPLATRQIAEPAPGIEGVDGGQGGAGKKRDADGVVKSS